MSFVIREFHNKETLGESLKLLRKAANITLSEMSVKTKIQKKHLKAFECGNYSVLPDPIYARNFLKLYVIALKGDVNYFLQRFDSEIQTCDIVTSSQTPRSRLRGMTRIIPSKVAKAVVLASFVVSAMFYMGIQVQGMISAPELVVFSPTDGDMTKDAVIVVTGQIEEGSQVTINENNVLLSQDGLFEHEVPLERGVNVIEIKGTKRYSKEAVEYRRIMLEQDKTISYLD